MNRSTLCRTDTGYPRRLAGLPDAPAKLHVLGQMCDGQYVVAIVGARAATGWAMDCARELAADLARAGTVVVSGGAIGIDAAAHRGALEAGGPTMAVLAGGLDVPYPARNRRLFDAMVATGGALLSPFQDGVPPRRWHFVRRNRIIAGLADAVVVVEAAAASGALYTARGASDCGRLVAAVPGTPGCQALIARGAVAIAGADDLFAALRGERQPEPATAGSAGGHDDRVLAALPPRGAASGEDVALTTGLPMRSVVRALSALELAGLAVALPGGQYARSAAGDAPAAQPGGRL